MNTFKNSCWSLNLTRDYTHGQKYIDIMREQLNLTHGHGRNLLSKSLHEHMRRASTLKLKILDDRWGSGTRGTCRIVPKTLS